MGQYEKWIGDIEDYTDEEVYDYSIGKVVRERIARLELAWKWCMVYRRSGAVSGPEGGRLNAVAGRGHKRGQVRICAEELHMLVTVPEDEATVVALPQWTVEPVKIDGVTNVYDLSRLYMKQVEGVLRDCATMTKAIPRYNRSVRNSAFPEKMWSRGVKQTFNRALYRFEKEWETWEATALTLKEHQY